MMEKHVTKSKKNYEHKPQIASLIPEVWGELSTILDTLLLNFENANNNLEAREKRIESKMRQNPFKPQIRKLSNEKYNIELEMHVGN